MRTAIRQGAGQRGFTSGGIADHDEALVQSLKAPIFAPIFVRALQRWY
jgi:hypothetical protein